MVPLSVLDLVPVVEGGSVAQSLHNAQQLAARAEGWGYRRYWVAEHHNMPGIASAATSVVLAHAATGTSRIRIGAGGIMLPNHAPLVIAEQFGTLAALHPDRIDLGVGRAPGTDAPTMHALRRNLAGGVDQFPDDLAELIGYFAPASPHRPVQAVPGQGANVDVWVLGSSLYGAQLAAAFGLPYAFASHFAPAALSQAVALYRSNFRPSARLAAPHVMLGVNVVAADTEADARLLATSLQQAFVSLRRGRRGLLPPPDARFEAQLGPAERAMLDEVLSCTFVGTPDAVRDGLNRFATQFGADELIVASMIHDHQARMRSYEIAAG